MGGGASPLLAYMGESPGNAAPIRGGVRVGSEVAKSVKSGSASGAHAYHRDKMSLNCGPIGANVGLFRGQSARVFFVFIYIPASFDVNFIFASVLAPKNDKKPQDDPACRPPT